MLSTLESIFVAHSSDLGFHLCSPRFQPREKRSQIQKGLQPLKYPQSLSGGSPRIHPGEERLGAPENASPLIARFSAGPGSWLDRRLKPLDQITVECVARNFARS